MTTPQQQWQELQEQNLEMLKAQQEAYLAGIKAWQTQLAATTEAVSQTPPQVPSFPQFAIPQVPTFPQAPTPAALPGISHRGGDRRDQPGVPGKDHRTAAGIHAAALDPEQPADLILPTPCGPHGSARSVADGTPFIRRPAATRRLT